MNSLHIYIDESGTPPTKDADDPFVMASVAVVGDHLVAPVFTGTRSELPGQLSDWGAKIGLVSVVPRPGYGDAFTHKLGVGTTMARAAALVFGRPPTYVPDRGTTPGSFVWTTALQHAVGIALLETLLEQDVSRVHVYVDEVTIRDKTEKLARDALQHKAKQLEEVASDHLGYGVPLAETLQQRAKAVSDKIEVIWTKKSDQSGARDGIRVADALSGLLLKDISPRGLHSPSSFVEDLVHAGYRVPLDITDLLMAPVGDDVVQ